MVDVGPFEIATLIIAVAGLALAMFSLGWQVFAWLASGARVKVETDVGLMVWEDGSMRDYIGVTVRNVGRTAVDATGWALSLPDDNQLAVADPEPWSGPRPPCGWSQDRRRRGAC